VVLQLVPAGLGHVGLAALLVVARRRPHDDAAVPAVASIGCVGCQLQSRTISRWYASAATSLPLTMSARARGRARQHRQCLFCKAQLPLHQLWGGFLCVTARICTESVCHLIPHNTRCGVICQLNRLRLDQLQIPAGSLARPHDAACSCDAGQRLYCLQEFETLQ